MVSGDIASKEGIDDGMSNDAIAPEKAINVSRPHSKTREEEVIGVEQ
jgi:hypothetical protein